MSAASSSTEDSSAPEASSAPDRPASAAASPASAGEADGADDEKNRELLWVLVDVVMLVLIIANLALIIFDWMFEQPSFQSVLETWTPGFHAFYDRTVHAHFFFYDLAFVAVFLTEIAVRWGVAIYRQTYHRWFFYPFVHWYDVIGCIPVSSFRSLRILRIFAMIPKMQRLGIVDLTDTYAYETFRKYRDIAVEEITDRVAVRIIGSVQQEIRASGPVTNRIAEEVIEPQREALIASITRRLQEATTKAYGSYREDFQAYVDRVIADAVNKNREIGMIAQVPGVGGMISRLLEQAISDIVYNVIDQMMADIASRENDELIAQITEISTDAVLSGEYDRELNRILRDLILESLDLVKEEVKVQEWKLREEGPLPGDLPPPDATPAPVGSSGD
jgi:hypothetical protein